MTEPAQPRHVPNAELELRDGPVVRDGGELRVLTGEDYGLVTSVMYSRIVPGSGPQRHRHPHAEIFVLHDGQGRYEVEGTHIDAVAGDMVIVPPDAWHSFTNTGDTLLRQTAIHQNPRAATEFEDGSTRG
jgi:quercetin dioxygenase-like cupin family protein